MLVVGMAQGLSFYPRQVDGEPHPCVLVRPPLAIACCGRSILSCPMMLHTHGGMHLWGTEASCRLYMSTVWHLNAHFLSLLEGFLHIHHICESGKSWGHQCACLTK